MTQIGESINIAVDASPPEEEPKKPPCKRIYLHAFRGDRSAAFVDAFEDKLEANKEGTGPGPTMDECLVYTGHVGVSFEAQSPIYGFNPTSDTEPIWQIIENLKGRRSYPGTVSDDSSAFSLAKQHGLTVLVIEFVYPEPVYNEIKAKFDAEKAGTGYRYSFPGGSGDCNCATFPRLIGLRIPEGSGRMSKYVERMAAAESPQKFGDCEG